MRTLSSTTVSGEVDDLETLHMMAREENDESLEPEIAEQAASLEAVLDELEMRSLFTGEFDERDAVCQIKSGEGGTDAQDWAEMLMRMYNRWADKRGFDIEILAVSEGTEAGLSNVEFVLKGRHAYGLMQAEHGVHRLVRISPFNNEGKRQTAFSAVQVAPFFEEVSEEIEIDEKDLRIDTYRRPVPAVSMSTSRTRPSASRTCPPVSSPPARTSGVSTRTRIEP